mgnify:CR=1 FL=1
MNTILHEVYEWVYSIIIALAIAMVIHIFFFQPTRVSGESMVPTLHNGEYLIVSKLGHVMGDVPDYGDIVIIDSRVLYERTWKDDVTEPMNNYLAFSIMICRRKRLGQAGYRPARRYAGLPRRQGMAQRRALGRAVYQRAHELQPQGRNQDSRGLRVLHGGQPQSQQRQPLYRSRACGSRIGQGNLVVP